MRRHQAAVFAEIISPGAGGSVGIGIRRIQIAGGSARCVIQAQVVAEFVRDDGGPWYRKARRAGPVGLPGEGLLGERVHAGGGLAGADGADDEDAGVEPHLGDDEPGGPLALARNGRMVQLADDERGRGIVRRGGPGGQPAPAAASCTRLEPYSPHREAEAPGEHDGDGGCRVVPDADRGVEARIVVGDQVEHRVPARAGERCPEGVSGGGAQRSADDGEHSWLHRFKPLPGRIAGRERPRRGGWHGRAHATFPDAVPGIPKGGSLPPRPHPPERHRRSGGRGATATRPATCGTAGAHMEAVFSCTCTPMSTCTRGMPPTAADQERRTAPYHWLSA